MTTTPKLTADNSNGATSQSDAPKVRVYKIRTGQVFDPIARVMLPRQVIWVDRDTGIVIRLGEEGEALRSEFELEVTDVDLTNLTVLPGFVDVHVHRMLIPHSNARLGFVGCPTD
jgi:imidazolonepropionase-like amidohydrolase